MLLTRTLGFLLTATLWLAGPAAHAAGMSTHAFMADTGRQVLPEGALKQILTFHRPSVLAGAIYPDGGYGSGVIDPTDRNIAEDAHWGQFHLAFIQYLRDLGCGTQAARLVTLPVPLPATLPGGTVNQSFVGTADIAGLTNECGQLIAFAFGIAAHGVTDETWDAQFESEVSAHSENPNYAHFLGAEGFWGPIAPASPLRQIFGDNYNYLSQVWALTPMDGVEYAMDVVGIVEHNIWANSPLLVFPPTDRLMEVYKRTNRPAAREQIERANIFSRGAVQAQASSANLEYQRVRAHMPWASNNYYLNAGGVIPSGHVVAGMYQYMWKLLTAPADTPVVKAVIPQEVIGHYPAHGQTGVRLLKDDGRGWTEHRWMHVFFASEIDPVSIEKPGAFCVFDEAGNRVKVTVQGGHGWSREWSHSTRIRLDQSLKPNHRYTAVVTPKVTDWNGQPLARPYSWQFVTAAD